MKSLALPFSVVGSVLKQKLDNAGHVPDPSAFRKCPAQGRRAGCTSAAFVEASAPPTHDRRLRRDRLSGAGVRRGLGGGGHSYLIRREDMSHEIIRRRLTADATHTCQIQHTHQKEAAERSFHRRRGSSEHRNTAPLKKLSGAD